MSTSRKPPSQRDPGYALQRMTRTLQSMSPGTMGGRVANAAPVSVNSAITTSIVSGGGGGDSASTGAWITDRFVAVDSTTTTFRLSYIPDVNGLFLFLNGLLLDEGTDFTVDYATGIVTLLF